jgi:chemotaxis protein CheZ
VQYKPFRIERMLADARGAAPADGSAGDAVAAFRRHLAALVADDEGRRLTRAAAELGAAMETMEKAAQAVLAAAESIDDGVRTRGCRPGGRGCALAPEMQRRVAQIYEACNFQDLAGQRIGKVIALLAHLEEQLAHVADGLDLAQAAHARPRDVLVNGPRLDGDSGHASQSDIDAMFD